MAAASRRHIPDHSRRSGRRSTAATSSTSASALLHPRSKINRSAVCRLDIPPRSGPGWRTAAFTRTPHGAKTNADSKSRSRLSSKCVGNGANRIHRKQRWQGSQSNFRRGRFRTCRCRRQCRAPVDIRPNDLQLGIGGSAIGSRPERGPRAIRGCFWAVAGDEPARILPRVTVKCDLDSRRTPGGKLATSRLLVICSPKAIPTAIAQT